MGVIIKLKIMKIVAIIIIILLVVFGVYFLFLGKASAPANQPSAPNTTNPASVTAGSTVAINNFAFSPSTLTVKKSDTVTWINEDSTTHTIKSDTFNSGSLNKGDTFKFQFSQAGTFSYSCGIHPFMQGTIIVQ